MRIGTDISIQTCRDEGYMVMDYSVQDFHKDPIQTDCLFTKSLPVYIREEMAWKVGDPIITTHVWFCWIDLYERYLEHKDGIDSYVGFDYSDIKRPTPHDVLNLASDIDSYCGLE